MTHGVSFSKIKLTNHIKNVSENGISTKKSAMLEEFKDSVDVDEKETMAKHKSTKFNVINSIARLPENHFYLSSFFMYEPCLYLIRHEDGKKYVSTIKFHETKFLAVTHYQNEKVNQLKKNYNPHAKGFKDDLFKTKKRNGREKKKIKSTEEDNESKNETMFIGKSNDDNSSGSKSMIKESMMDNKNYNTSISHKNNRINTSEKYFKKNENAISNLSSMDLKEKKLLQKLSRKRKLLKKRYKSSRNKKENYLNSLVGNLMQDNYLKSKFDSKNLIEDLNQNRSMNELIMKGSNKNNNIKNNKNIWQNNKEISQSSNFSLLNPSTDNLNTDFDYSSIFLNGQDSAANTSLNYNDPSNHSLNLDNIKFDSLLKTPVPSISPFFESNPLMNSSYKTININNSNDGSNNNQSYYQNFSNDDYKTNLNINDTFLLNKDNTFTLINDSKSDKGKMEDLSSLNSLLNMDNYASNHVEHLPKL